MYNLVQTGHLSRKESTGFASKYYKKRLKKIEGILHLPSQEITHEGIHALRVELKKMRALFELLRYSDKDFRFPKFFGPFKLLFKEAGDIRGAQVEQELLKKRMPDTPSKYLDQLQRLEKKKRRAVEKITPGTIAKIESQKSRITSHLDTVTENDVKSLLKKRAKQLSALMERSIFKEQDLHIIRKKLKGFYFIARTTYPNMSIPKPCNRLQTLFGTWHDNQVAIDHLRKAVFSSQFNQDEIKQLQKIKRELIENREKLFDQILSTYVLIERT